MATWNMGQYDAALNDAQRTLDNQYRRQQAEFLQDYKRSEQQRLIDNEMNRRKVAAEQLKYDRDRQAVSDKRAALDYEFKDRARKRAEELAIAQHGYQMQNLAAKQKFDNLTLQNKIKAQNDAALQRDYLGRNYTPYQEALLKLNANGGNINALSNDEKNIIYQKIEEENQYTPDEEDFKVLVTPEYQKEQGINPDFVSLYAREQRATATKDAEYQRKNAPAIAKQKQQEQYNTVSGFMTGFYNDAVKSGSIDPKVSKSKDVVDAATRIFIASNGSLTPQQAFNQAAGIKGKNSNISEQAEKLYGAQYLDMDDDDKKKIELMLTKFSAAKNAFDNKNYPKGSAEELNALRELEEIWRQMANAAGFGNVTDTYSNVKSPIFERLQHADYELTHQEMLDREKALSKKYPRYFKWVKDNPRVGFHNYARHLVSPEEYEETTAPTGNIVKQVPAYFRDFIGELDKIQNLRNHLVELEGRIENNRNRYVD